MIYNQVLTCEIIELHKLSQLIESKGGKLYDLKTDAITCTFPDNEFPFTVQDDNNIEGYYYSEGKPKYKTETTHRTIINAKNQHNKPKTIQFTPPNNI